MMRRYHRLYLATEGCLHSLCSRLRDLERAVQRLEKVLETNSDDSFLKELSRSLALTGDGARLDRTIRTCIEWYCEVRTEVRRISSNKELTDEQREDVSTGLHTVLDRHAEALARLDVSILEIELGTKLESCNAHVINELETERKRDLNTVAECLQPQFNWTNGFGQQRVEVAKVNAFTKLTSRRSEHTRWKSTW